MRISPGAVELGYWVHVDFTGRGYATACARALTQAGLALSDLARVEIHTDEANAISAAIPRRLGYRLDRVDEQGWPHFSQLKALPVMNVAEQENFMKDHILLYFSHSEIGEEPDSL